MGKPLVGLVKKVSTATTVIVTMVCAFVKLASTPVLVVTLNGAQCNALTTVAVIKPQMDIANVILDGVALVARNQLVPMIAMVMEHARQQAFAFVMLVSLVLLVKRLCAQIIAICAELAFLDNANVQRVTKAWIAHLVNVQMIVANMDVASMELAVVSQALEESIVPALIAPTHALTTVFVRKVHAVAIPATLGRIAQNAFAPTTVLTTGFARTSRAIATLGTLVSTAAC